ncbi:MAG TPA: 1-(5-phosphoribosyl)-5-[(5-phosphoribosylamino)methylideneamino]imidazole-4-carboxamide isomerase [Cerasibacillus sp.]|uniref:1-(5-phosphoribosyl)-5-[(5- phosphoribosylamino)methylideneamino]imidazole-4- carboxamide isomerase n=1 Tax=Cerasibacillus sp. TaxID=2498711 RepID=UPI002F41E2A6
MILIPAIDLLDGRCVRLQQGQYNQQTIYSDSPVQMAEYWEEKGAPYLHVVDLDAARTNEVKNKEYIKKIAQSVQIPIQVGGGIRSLERIEMYLKAGVTRVIIGTAAITDPIFLKKAIDYYGDKIVVSIDAKNGYVATEGWEETSDVKAIKLGHRLQKMGVKTIVYTDIAKDGMLQGPNFDELKQITEQTDLQVIASGGVSTPKDIEQLKQLNVYGAIVGKALYDGTVTLESLLEVV